MKNFLWFVLHLKAFFHSIDVIARCGHFLWPEMINDKFCCSWIGFELMHIILPGRQRGGACILRYGSNYCDVEVCRSSIDRPDRFRSLRKYNLEDILLQINSILQFQQKLLESWRPRILDSDTRSISFPSISIYTVFISLVLLQFINILLSCNHLILSSVISFIAEGVLFLRISVRVTSSINLWDGHCTINSLINAMNVSGPSQVPWGMPPLREKKLLFNLILCLRS